MNLLELSPDIQEEILFLPLTERGPGCDDGTGFAKGGGNHELGKAKNQMELTLFRFYPHLKHTIDFHVAIKIANHE